VWCGKGFLFVVWCFLVVRGVIAVVCLFRVFLW